MTWFMCFCSMLAIYFLISWLPTLIRMEGMPTGLSIGAAIALNIGGVIGGVLIGAAGDKVGSARALAAAYILGAIAIWLIEPVGQTATLIVLITGREGAFRSEEGRVGKEWGGTWRYRGGADQQKNKKRIKRK